MKSLINKIYAGLGLGGILLIIISVAVLAYVLIRKERLSKNPLYTKGVVIGFKEEARGSIYLHYSFISNQKFYEGSVTTKFCDECNRTCCNPGDTVIVKYEKGNPKNNSLVHSLPEGASIDNSENAPN